MPPTFRIGQKNALFQIVETQGLDPTSFSWEGPAGPDTSTAWKFRIEGPAHPNHPLNPTTPPVFAFGISVYSEDLADGPYDYGYRPHPTRDAVSFEGATWSQVRAAFETWVGAVKALQQPDHWQEAAQQRAITASVVAEYDTPFTVEEIGRIGESFDKARDEIAQKRLLTAEDLADLTQEMVKQRRSATLTGRIDWQKTAVQEWIKWVIRRGLDSIVAQQILDIIASKFAWLSHHLGAAVSAMHKFLSS
jgi:hypothetical protein